jgi:hypothetical protein
MMPPEGVVRGARKSWLVLVAVLAACGAELRRFPLRPPMARDTDLDSRAVPCRPDPKPGKDGRPHQLCRPEEYVSSFTWDGADNIFFRPVARFFAVDPHGEAVNVNAFDEVPDSSWFTNRMGVRHLSPEELVQGPCSEGPIDVDGPDGSVVIDLGKPNGANPGFRIRLANGRKYMLKADDDATEPERASGATAVATRLYHAAGWYAACDTIIYLRPAVLRLTPGLTVTDNRGVTSPFDAAALANVIGKASHRGELVRFAASRWLPGRTIGPFTYSGLRDDDSNDVIPHEDRRDLRGARLMSAWTSHYDSREQNSMNVWFADDPNDPDASPGKVLHYYLDLGDCFGGAWSPDELWRRFDHSYLFDAGEMLFDFTTLGIVERPWERKHKPEHTLFGYYSSDEFDPEAWRGMYPNPAFQNMTERDGAWIARIIARFTDADLATIAGVGGFTDPAQTALLADTLAKRRDKILRRYFARLSPVTDLAVSGDALCGVDLARRSGLFPAAAFAYRAQAAGRPDPRVAVEADGRICLALTHRPGLDGRRDDDPERYLIVRLNNGQAAGTLRAHLYDLGAERGFALVGIER